MLKEITIQHFKGIREGMLGNLAQVNILVGRNNTGKSTLVEAIVLTSPGARGGDVLGRTWDQLVGDRIGRRPSEAEYRFGLDESKEIRFGVRFADDKEVIFVVRAHFNINTPDPRPDDWAKVIGAENLQTIAGTTLIDSQLIRQLGLIEGRLWTEIARDRRDRTLARVLRETYDVEIEDLTYLRFGDAYKLAIKTPVHTVPVDDFGEGLRYGLAVLFVAASLKNTILLWEEPESHQHPEAMGKLTLALFKLAQENHLQLFLTTHSLEFITYALDAAEQAGLELRVHHCSLSSDGQFLARSIPAPDARVLADLGHDVRLQYKYLVQP